MGTHKLDPSSRARIGAHHAGQSRRPADPAPSEEFKIEGRLAERRGWTDEFHTGWDEYAQFAKVREIAISGTFAKSERGATVSELLVRTEDRDPVLQKHGPYV